MNLQNISPEILNPPALYQQAFDEERALAEIKALTEQRDEGTGIYKSAVLALGQKFIEARRAMPGLPRPNGVGETYSPAFLAFVEKSGYAKQTAKGYMAFVSKPGWYERFKELNKKGGGTSGASRRRVLKEIRDALIGSTKEEVLEAITEELAKHGNA